MWVQHNLRIHDNDALRDLDGLSGVVGNHPKYVTIEGNALLESVDGLAGLAATTIRYLTIKANPSLCATDVSALEALLDITITSDCSSNDEEC